MASVQCTTCTSVYDAPGCLVWLCIRCQQLREEHNLGPSTRDSHCEYTPPPCCSPSLEHSRTSTSTFDTELREAELAVVVPQHEVEVLPRQLLLVLEARLPEHGLHDLGQLRLGQAVVGDLDEGPGVGRGEPSVKSPLTSAPAPQ